tara:strand:- start:379 stop:1089 length:711 start_codon:yes stop_codon:yes gene_type:complete
MSSSSYIKLPKDEDKSFHSDWIKKSRVNYFACFMELWVGFNAWFKQACGETKDRSCIEMLKKGELDSGELYGVFDQLFHDSFKEAIVFRGNLEALYYTLNAANLKYPEGPKSKADPEVIEYRVVGFNSALPEWPKRRNPSGYHDLFHSFKPSTTPEAEAEEQKIEENPDYPDEFVELDEIRLINEPKLVFAGLIEIIYQIRCKLFHGDLDPDDPVHYDAVKYCYELLSEMASRLKK